MRDRRETWRDRREVERGGEGERGRWRDGDVERWRDGEIGLWRDRDVVR